MSAESLAIALRYIVTNTNRGEIPNGWLNNIARAADELDSRREVTDAMVEAAAREHVIVLAALDRKRGHYVPGDPTLDKFAPELREDSLKAMRASLEAALSLQPTT